MKEGFNVTIIDDHPLITEAYNTILKKIYDDKDLNIKILGNLDSVKNLINSSSHFENVDLVFLDINLPQSKEGDLLSGEDVGVLLKKEFPEIKIIISTTFSDSFRIHNILKNVNPDAFLIKNDVTSSELQDAIIATVNHPPYYSKTVLNLMRKQMSNEFLLDGTDRRLLYEISIGTKMKELPEILPLSIAGIEKRKRNLKIMFGVEEDGDRSLVLIAKDKGFI
jgi:DNA-binding NarL/FixJ family response regulator